MVVMDGLVLAELDVEGGLSIPLDYLSKGAVVRPHHALVNRPNTTRYSVLQTTLVFTLKTETLLLLSLHYPELKAVLQPAIEDARARMLEQQRYADYITGETE